MKSKDKIIYYLLCLYILLRPIFYSGIDLEFIPVLHKIPSLSDSILFLLIIVYLIKIIIDKRIFISNLKNFISDILGISMLALLAVMCISIIYASYKLIAISESARFLSFLILYFIIKYEVDSRKLKGIMNCYFISFAIENIYGIFQKITGHGLMTGYSMITSNVLRTMGTFDNPNTFAAFLIFGVFPVVMMIVYSKSVPAKIVYGVFLVTAILNIYFAGSRNSYIALVIGAVAISLLYSWKFLFGLVPIGAAALLIAPVRDRVLAIGNDSLNESRIKLWQTALKMIQNHPIIGVGNGNYVKLYDEYVNKYKYLAYKDYSHYPTHNSYLKIEAELGIAGGISFLSIIISSVIKINTAIHKIKDKKINLFYIGFFASVIGFLFMNLLDNLFFTPEIAAYFWIFLAAADGLALKNNQSYL